jgi:predicted nuclease with TOPRIM domain
MDAMSSQEGQKKKYTTPRWVQVWFLHRSRDNWKKKYQDLKVQNKRLQNRVNDVSKSREKWHEQVRQLQEENALLRQQAPGRLQEQAALKKDGPA